MSDDIRVGDLIEIRWDGTETRVVGRVRNERPDGVDIEGYGHVWSDVPGRTVTVLERPEPPMEPLPTRLGAHIVATIADDYVPIHGREAEAVCLGDASWLTSYGCNVPVYRIKSWRWADNPRPLPTPQELYDLDVIDTPPNRGIEKALDYLRERGYVR